MPIAKNFQSIYSQDWEINFTHCTPNGFLKYTELCNLLQLTAGSHAETGGMSFTDMQHYNQAWVLSRMRVEIQELPKWRDTVTVSTWIKDIEGARSIRCMEVHIGDRKVAGCETYWAVFNTQTRRAEPLAMPNDHFIRYSEKHATTETFTKINIDAAATLATERQIVLSDLDIVNHVNNVKYLEWCLDIVPYQMILSQKLQSFDMNFMRELKHADTVQIKQLETENQSLYTVSKADKTCFALQLDWK